MKNENIKGFEMSVKAARKKKAAKKEDNGNRRGEGCVKPVPIPEVPGESLKEILEMGLGESLPAGVQIEAGRILIPTDASDKGSHVKVWVELAETLVEELGLSEAGVTVVVVEQPAAAPVESPKEIQTAPAIGQAVVMGHPPERRHRSKKAGKVSSTYSGVTPGIVAKVLPKLLSGDEGAINMVSFWDPEDSIAAPLVSAVRRGSPASSVTLSRKEAGRMKKALGSNIPPEIRKILVNASPGQGRDEQKNTTASLSVMRRRWFAGELTPGEVKKHVDNGGDRAILGLIQAAL